jgi:hypothetical protein
MHCLSASATPSWREVLCIRNTLKPKRPLTLTSNHAVTAGCLSFHPMAQCVVHALKSQKHNIFFNGSKTYVPGGSSKMRHICNNVLECPTAVPLPDIRYCVLIASKLPVVPSTTASSNWKQNINTVNLLMAASARVIFTGRGSLFWPTLVSLPVSAQT